jgi:hypothetical protein
MICVVVLLADDDRHGQTMADRSLLLPTESVNLLEKQ